MQLQSLTSKHRLFVEAYTGDTILAMRIAGYLGPDKYLEKEGKLLLEDPLIVEAINERSRYSAKVKSAIATREERQQFWTNLMRNEDPHLKPETDIHGIPVKQPANLPHAVRLKASEMLGKSEADFMEKLDITQNVTISDIIMQSYQDDGKSIEAIEAEYNLVRQRKLQDASIDILPIETESIETIDDLI